MTHGPLGPDSDNTGIPGAPAIPTGIIVLSSVEELREILGQHRVAGHSIGFVPTMGFFHSGHSSLMRSAATANDVVVVSIFVNPLQFAPHEDLADYPRDLENDITLADQSGVQYLFVPELDDMYPVKPVSTTINVAGLSEGLEGKSRPTHFGGVATVVAKLFSIVGPSTAYFGEKDYQQLLVIKRMVVDLLLPVRVIGCPTIREADGLAMSSRNSYLKPKERGAAATLFKALKVGTRAIADGIREPALVVAGMVSVLSDEPLIEIDYVDVVDADSLITPSVLRGDVRLMLAAQVGRCRLIDNCGVSI